MFCKLVFQKLLYVRQRIMFQFTDNRSMILYMDTVINECAVFLLVLLYLNTQCPVLHRRETGQCLLKDDDSVVDSLETSQIPSSIQA